MPQRIKLCDGTTVMAEVQFMPNNPHAFVALHLGEVGTGDWRRIRDLYKKNHLVKVKPRGAIVISPRPGEFYTRGDRANALQQMLIIMGNSKQTRVNQPPTKKKRRRHGHQNGMVPQPIHSF